MNSGKQKYRNCCVWKQRLFMTKNIGGTRRQSLLLLLTWNKGRIIRQSLLLLARNICGIRRQRLSLLSKNMGSIGRQRLRATICYEYIIIHVLFSLLRKNISIKTSNKKKIAVTSNLHVDTIVSRVAWEHKAYRRAPNFLNIRISEVRGTHESKDTIIFWVCAPRIPAW